MCCESIDTMTSAPARAWPWRSRAARQNASASIPAATSNTITIGVPRRNGCVTAVSGAMIASRIAICNVVTSAVRGARAKSTRPMAATGSARTASTSPSRHDMRTRPKTSGIAAAIAPMITTRRASVSDQSK